MYSLGLLRNMEGGGFLMRVMKNIEMVSTNSELNWRWFV
jgi:hypothetical protein